MEASKWLTKSKIRCWSSGRVFESSVLRIRGQESPQSQTPGAPVQFWSPPIAVLARIAETVPVLLAAGARQARVSSRKDARFVGELDSVSLRLAACTCRCTLCSMERQQYSIADARKNLPSLVDEAEAGCEVQLTRRGRPVAVVVSIEQFERLKANKANFAEAYRAFRRRFPEGTTGLGSRYFESLRDRGSGRKVTL